MVKKTDEVVDFPQAAAEFFALLTDVQRNVVLSYTVIRTFKKNETIYNEQDIPSSLMILLSGKVKIFKEGVGGRNQIMRMMKPVEYFGYRAWFAQEPYITCACSCEAATVAFLPMNVLKALIQENHQLAFYFICQLSKDLGIADERMVNLTQKHIRGRLAESLLFLKENYGVEDDGITLNIYLSREDLANLSNMTPANAIRTLSAFVNEDLIIVDGRKIKIINDIELEKVSKLG